MWKCDKCGMKFNDKKIALNHERDCNYGKKIKKKCKECGKDLTWFDDKYCKDCVKRNSFATKRKILDALKKIEDSRLIELEIQGIKSTKEDILRRNKIKELEKETKAGMIFGRSAIATSLFIYTGFIFFGLALICIFTIILAPLSIFLFALGIFSIILGIVIGGIGFLSGLIAHILNKDKPSNKS
jgi:hypothetical protein